MEFPIQIMERRKWTGICSSLATRPMVDAYSLAASAATRTIRSVEEYVTKELVVDDDPGDPAKASVPHIAVALV